MRRLMGRRGRWSAVDASVAGSAGRAAVLMAVGFVAATGAAAQPATIPFAEFLASKQIDAASRQPLVADGAWTDDKERLVVRVLSRLAAPAPLEAAWRREAVEFDATASPAAGDRLVRIAGRATFVAPRVLPAEIAELAGWPHYDMVRVVTGAGAAVDVVVRRAPRSWPRWQAIDEAAEVVGLPLVTGVGPGVAGPPQGGESWPRQPAGLVVAATGITWRPDTPLAALGFDYGLFDTVVDNRRLEPGDTAAFWALLAAVGQASARDIEAAAGGRTEVLPMIDPKQKWFAKHRGDPVVIEGIARKATRIAIDDQADRNRIGSDHYWELDVFADTPTIQVQDRIQDRYPIVCCVRSLPAGMPTGDAIAERVRVPGFGFKRYSYSIREPIEAPPAGQPVSREERMATPLVVGREAIWLRSPSTTGFSNSLFWLFAGITGLVGLLLAWNAWALSRDSRRLARQRREELPDRIDLPGGRE